ncbi:MAG: N-formylglutamate amidohydrolase [Rhizobiales bacterium]|nr:N-formylglutamate amidohydrolase [Hyphomicrobiales bacterium]
MNTHSQFTSVYNACTKPRYILICEHASNFIPEYYNSLGVGSEITNSHVAYDPGALEVAKLMAKSLCAPLITQNVSRLVYDCNRPPNAKSAMPSKSEIYDIIGNQNLSESQRAERAIKFYAPFCNLISSIIDTEINQQNYPIIITIHSFTPIYYGKKRNLDIGILHDDDSRFADEILKLTDLQQNLQIKRNAPYGPEDGVTHSLKLHAQSRGLANVMLEINNSIIANATTQKSIANLLSDYMRQAADNLTIEKRD